jgi:hypothetical protein
MPQSKPARKLEPNVADMVWVGEGRWADTKRWYTLFSTCQLTRNYARIALGNHPDREQFDKTRVRKFIRR